MTNKDQTSKPYFSFFRYLVKRCFIISFLVLHHVADAQSKPQNELQPTEAIQHPNSNWQYIVFVLAVLAVIITLQFRKAFSENSKDL